MPAHRAAPATDERGISRPQGAGVDIGAIEVRSDAKSLVETTNFAYPISVLTHTAAVNTAFAQPLTYHFFNPDTGAPIVGQHVTFALTTDTSGATGIFQSTNSPISDANGNVSVSLAANGFVGVYDITSPFVTLIPGSGASGIAEFANVAFFPSQTASTTNHTTVVPQDLPTLPAFTTRVIAILNGKQTVLNLTTNHPPGSAEVTALLSQAIAALRNAGGQQISSPVLAQAYSVGSSVYIGRTSAGSSQTVSNSVTIGPGTVLYGSDQSQTLFVPAGHTNVNTNTHNESFFTDNYQPTTTYIATYVVTATAPERRNRWRERKWPRNYSNTGDCYEYPVPAIESDLSRNSDRRLPHVEKAWGIGWRRR